LKTLKFNIACINQCTEAEGPGRRLAIWFQGCDKHCENCCNPELLELKAANILSIDQIIDIIKEAKIQFNIEGITFLGGEPVLQQGLAELSQKIRDLGLGTILLTGKNIEELNEQIKDSVDLIIDGGYEKDKPDNERNLIGSSNQRIFFITERYREDKDWFFIPRLKRLEINISDNSGLFITGDKLL